MTGGDGPGGAAAGCELCEAARMTTWHYEDEVCWVADCEVCDVPMVVWRHHGARPPQDDLDHMLGRLGAVADRVLGAGTWTVDPVMRQIPDHFHAHARDGGWWHRRFGGGTTAHRGRTGPAAAGAGEPAG